MILSRKSFEALMNIESVGAQRAVPSHCSASESSNTHSSPRASIHQGQRGPPTGDYHTTGSPAANDMESDQNSQQTGPVRGNQGTEPRLARRVCLRKWLGGGGESAVMRSKCCRSEAKRDFNEGRAASIMQTPMGGFHTMAVTTAALANPLTIFTLRNT